MALFGKKKKAEATDEAPVMPAEEPIQKSDEDAAPAAAPKLKVRADAYTLLLGLSVVALIVACVLLYLNIAEYGSSPMSGLKG